MLKNQRAGLKLGGLTLTSLEESILHVNNVVCIFRLTMSEEHESPIHPKLRAFLIQRGVSASIGR